MDQNLYSKDIDYDRDSNNSDETDVLLKSNLINKQENTFVAKYKYLFLVPAAMVMFGGFYNNQFQAFIKEQFLTSMNMDNAQYSQFLFIPPLPNIIFPIIAGPLLDILGIRRGLIFFCFIMSIGMSLIYFSAFQNSFSLILIGKIIHQLGTENLHLTQSKIHYNYYIHQLLRCFRIYKRNESKNNDKAKTFLNFQQKNGRNNLIITHRFKHQYNEQNQMID